jgi:SSS family solute:Na+ symporter
MHWFDYTLIAGYLGFMLGLGFYFWRRQERVDEYFVGDRQMGAGHIGFSVVATDVGGGFSIGLGGLGFTMGLAGSWLLFSGLIGAWAAAVLLIPRVKALGDRYRLLTYPAFLEHRYDGRTRALAALVSGVGYAGFVGAQILAGAKLGSAVFEVDQTTAVWVMAAVVVVYTAAGGLQAVVYTDTVQWVVLLVGLAFFALPFAYVELGGWESIVSSLPAEHLSLTAIGWETALLWMVTIVPIWFVGMTLYQRIYATRDVQTATRAWYLAGLLEWPLMAFLGVFLGMMARAMFPTAEAEMGLPLLLRHALPVGVVGVVSAAYFSAILSTADSCLLASVGNFVNDLYQVHARREASERRVLALSRGLTVVIGLLSTAVALTLPRVLDAVLLAYAFMVSGLFMPTLLGLWWPRVSARAALASMIAGGGTALLLSLAPAWNPFVCAGWLLDSSPLTEPIMVALPLSAVVLVAWTLVDSR